MDAVGSSGKKVFRTLSVLLFGSLTGAAIAFITQVILARVLSPNEYGMFSASLAIITLVTPFAGFGISGLWLKVFGAEGWHALRWLRSSYIYIVLSTLLVVLVLGGWALFGPHDYLTTYLFFVLIPVSLTTLLNGLVSCKFQLEERFRALALWQFAPHCSRFVFIVLFMLMMPDHLTVVYVAAIYSVVGFIASFVGISQLHAMSNGGFLLVGHDAPTGSSDDFNDKISLMDVARRSWPFGLGIVFHLIYFQSDVILLKYFSGDSIAGIYNVAFTVMMAVYLLPGVIYQKYLLPKFHRWANHDRVRFLAVYRVGNGCMLLLGVLIAIVMLLVVPWVIPLLFGNEYIQAIDLLMVLSLCVPLRFLASNVGAVLLTQQHILRKVIYMGFVALFNVVLNLFLIPLYGAMGATVSTLLSEVLLLIFYLFAVRKYVFGRDAWCGWTFLYKGAHTSHR